MGEQEVGKLVIDFEADINEFKIAISEVKSLLKDVSSETRQSSADFAMLAGVTGGAVSFGLNTMKEGLGSIMGGLNEYLSTTPEFVQAQSDLNMTFRDLATDVGPGVSNVLQGFNNILTAMRDAGFFDTINEGLMNFGDTLKTINSEDLVELNRMFKSAVDLLGSLTDETVMSAWKESFKDVQVVFGAIADTITFIKNTVDYLKGEGIFAPEAGGAGGLGGGTSGGGGGVRADETITVGDVLGDAIKAGFIDVIDYLKVAWN